MGSIPGAVVLGKACHRALLQLFDPFDLSLKTIADIDGEPGVFGIEDVSLGALLESVGVSLNEIFEPVDPTIEFSYLGHVVVFSLFDRLEQRLGDALQGVGVEVSAAVEDVSG